MKQLENKTIATKCQIAVRVSKCSRSHRKERSKLAGFYREGLGMREKRWEDE